MDYQGKRIHHDCLVDDSKNYLYLEENKDAENNNDANQLAYIASRKPNNTLCNGVLVHTNVCYINCNGIRYRVYACGKYGILPDDMRMDDIEKMVKTIGGVLMQWHENNILHFDMNPQSILVNLQGEYAIWEYSHIRSVNTFKEHNPIIGSTIASPLQIILEMLNSKVEANMIDFDDFKTKMRNFYMRMMHPGFKDVLDVCQRYYGLVNGAQDYVDYIINKFTVFENGKINKLASPSKALIYIKDIDWFSFGLMCHKKIIASSDMTKAPSQWLINFITSCLCFDNFIETPNILMTECVDACPFGFDRTFTDIEHVEEYVPPIVEEIVNQVEIVEKIKEEIVNQVEIVEKIKDIVIDTATDTIIETCEIHTITEAKVEAVEAILPINKQLKVKQEHIPNIDTKQLLASIPKMTAATKIRVHGQERVIRTDAKGSHVLISGRKLYIAELDESAFV
jgi:hypothetical protein